MEEPHTAAHQLQKLAVAVQVLLGILHMQESEREGIALRPVLGHLMLSWRQLQKHMPAPHILASSSFRRHARAVQ